MHPLCVLLGALLGVAFAGAANDEPIEVAFQACPPAVRRTLLAESKAPAIANVEKDKDEEGATVYTARVPIGGRTYAVAVHEDGTLAEMGLVVESEAELTLERCPAAVQTTLRREAFGEKIGPILKGLGYGVTIYEATVVYRGKTYEIVVAEDGTLFEKNLHIDEDEVELATCPAAVRAAFREHARNATFREITRSTGIGHPTYMAEVEIGGKLYLVHVAENGMLISKILDDEDPEPAR